MRVCARDDAQHPILWSFAHRRGRSSVSYARCPIAQGLYQPWPTVKTRLDHQIGQSYLLHRVVTMGKHHSCNAKTQRVEAAGPYLWRFWCTQRRGFIGIVNVFEWYCREYPIAFLRSSCRGAVPMPVRGGELKTHRTVDRAIQMCEHRYDVPLPDAVFP